MNDGLTLFILSKDIYCTVGKIIQLGIYQDAIRFCSYRREFIRETFGVPDVWNNVGK
jgi:hypothetical protein